MKSFWQKRVKHLPKAEDATPFDIICIADSISRGRLEAFYATKINNHTDLGDFVREEILYKWRDDLDMDRLA